MGRLFGTDGIRGEANRELTPELAMQVAQAAGAIIKEKTNKKPVFLIGKDTRLSSDMLEAAMAAGLCAAGCDVKLIGVVPTPAVAYLTTALGADAGIMLTASHNPYPDNGIKIIGPDGFKLTDGQEKEIEEIVLGHEAMPKKAEKDEIGSIAKNAGVVEKYIEYLTGLCKTPLDGLYVAIDCANGCASVSARQIFTRLGARCDVLYDKPNGTNVNAGCGSTHLEKLSEYVKTHGCDVGLAFDGDADRLLAIDHTGEVVAGDELMAVLALDLKKQGKLKKDGLVVTVMSNLGLFHFAKESGMITPVAQVGDRYVLEKMLAEGYCIGGEQSGHIIFLDEMTTGDGQLSAIHLLEVIKRENKPLATLKKLMTNYPQVLKNVAASDGMKQNLGKLAGFFEEKNAQLGDEGRVLVRASGTEPIIRVMIEGKEQKMIQQMADEIAEVITAKLG